MPKQLKTLEIIGGAFNLASSIGKKNKPLSAQRNAENNPLRLKEHNNRKERQGTQRLKRKGITI